jgi:hypothetical protein
MRWLLVIAFGALALRVTYVVAVKHGPCPILFSGQEVGRYHSECTGPAKGIASDQTYYNSTANWLAAGNLFTDPFNPQHPEAADHPPLTVVVLAPVSFAFNHAPLIWLADRTKLADGRTIQTHVREHRLTMAVLGALVVLLIGILARRIAGDRAAIIAALIAAIYPNLWVNDGLIFSETVANVVILVLMLVALRAADRPSLGRAAAVGALAAVAALARAELGLLVLLLGLPVALALRGRRVRAVLVTLAAALVVLAPWVVYNNVRFHDRTFISTNDGLAMGASNCRASFYGSGVGLTTLVPPCTLTPEQQAKLGDQSQVATEYRSRAFEYMGKHLDRVPFVVLVRVLRTWSFWNPGQMVTFNEGEGRGRAASWAGLAFYYPLLIGAVAGGVLLVRQRRGRVLWILAAPAVALTIGVAITYGQVRFRAAAEPSIVVLSAVAIDGFVRWRRARNPDQATDTTHDATATASASVS